MTHGNARSFRRVYKGSQRPVLRRVLIATVMLITTCGPTAAPITLDTSPVRSLRETPTAAAWRTPSPDTATVGPTAAAAAMAKPAPTPTAVPAPTVQPPPRPPVAPSAAAQRSPVATLKPEAPVECRFATGAMQVPIGVQSVAGTPAQQPPTPNWITVA